MPNQWLLSLAPGSPGTFPRGCSIIGGDGLGDCRGRSNQRVGSHKLSLFEQCWEGGSFAGFPSTIGILWGMPFFIAAIAAFMPFQSAER